MQCEQRESTHIRVVGENEVCLGMTVVEPTHKTWKATHTSSFTHTQSVPQLSAWCEWTFTTRRGWLHFPSEKFQPTFYTTKTDVGCTCIVTDSRNWGGSAYKGNCHFSWRNSRAIKNFRIATIYSEEDVEKVPSQVCRFTNFKFFKLHIKTLRKTVSTEAAWNLLVKLQIITEIIEGGKC